MSWCVLTWSYDQCPLPVRITGYFIFPRSNFYSRHSVNKTIIKNTRFLTIDNKTTDNNNSKVANRLDNKTGKINSSATLYLECCQNLLDSHSSVLVKFINKSNHLSYFA